MRVLPHFYSKTTVELLLLAIREAEKANTAPVSETRYAIITPRVK